MTERSEVGPEPFGRRDVDRIVAATNDAARALDIPGARSPWLPPLPERIGVDELGVTPTLSLIPLGLEDDPGAQAQRAWCWRVDDGHLGLAGGGRSGRTSAILTVVGQLLRAGSAADVHVYAIGPPTLAVLAPMPHVAAVADVDDADYVRLVVEHLTARSGGRQSPAARVVVVIDGWERLAAHAHGALAAEVRALVDSSAGSGLRAVVSGGRAVLAGQLASLFAQRLILPLADPVELAVAGIPVKAVPAHQSAGRGIDARTHREVQVALPDVSRVPPRPAATGDSGRGWPTPIHRLPSEVSLLGLSGGGGRGGPGGPGRPGPPGRQGNPDRVAVLPVGVRAGDLETCGLNLAAGERRVLVHGPPRSGRTNAVEVIGSGLVRAGHPVALLGTRWSSTPPGDVVLSVDGSLEADRDRLIEVRRAHPDLALVVDDGERLSSLPIEPVLLEIARRVDEDRGVIVVATSTNALEGRVGALATDLARAHTGIELWPTGAARVPGRGLLRTPRGVERIQVARLS